MASLEPPLAELLIRLVELDAGSYGTFVPAVTGESYPDAELIGGPYGDQRIPPGPTVELANRGYLEMERQAGKTIGHFRISEKGRQAAAQLASESQGTIDLSWPAVEPVLVEIHRAWLNAGAPTAGLNGSEISGKLDTPADQLAPVLAALREGEWIDYRELMGPPLPQGIRPTPKAIARLGGWPSGDGDEFGKALLALLDERIEAEPDAEKKSKLKAALSQGGTGFRELLIEVTAAVLARQVGG